MHVITVFFRSLKMLQVHEPIIILKVQPNTVKPKACVRVFKQNVICVELFMGPVCWMSDKNVGCFSIEHE